MLCEYTTSLWKTQSHLSEAGLSFVPTIILLRLQVASKESPTRFIDHFGLVWFDFSFICCVGEVSGWLVGDNISRNCRSSTLNSQQTLITSQALWFDRWKRRENWFILEQLEIEFSRNTLRCCGYQTLQSLIQYVYFFGLSHAAGKTKNQRIQTICNFKHCLILYAGVLDTLLRHQQVAPEVNQTPHNLL